jgi:hypothetical protein
MFEYSIFIFSVSIILKVVLNVNSHYFKEDFYENLENKKDDKNDNDKNDNDDSVDDADHDTIKDDTNHDTIKDGEDDDSEKETNESTKIDKTNSTNKGEHKSTNSTNSTNDLSENEIEMLDFTEALDKVDENEKFKGADLNLITPAQAQRELYRLVDTTSLLTKTMNELSPILNEGKNIMNTLEQLNITSKLAK